MGTFNETELIRRGRVGVINCRECNVAMNVAQLAPFTVVECPSCKTRTRVPVKYAHFHLQDRAGEDRLGLLFVAFDTTLHRFVLLRSLDSAISADRKAAGTFLVAARASSSLNHRQVLQVYSAAEHEGHVYVAMEHTPGGRLTKALDGGKTLPESRALRIALDVAMGLQAGHAAGLVHGDVSPEHIHLDNAGGAKIAEFGSHLVGAIAGHNGDPRFIAPECARGGQSDARADFYSLGAVLYLALTGRNPFEGPTRADMIAARLKAPPPPVRSVNAAISGATERLVARMLAADPAKRHPNAASLIADLRAALEAPPASATSTSAVSPGAVQTPAAGKPVGLWIGVAVAAVALAGAGFFLLGGKGSKQAGGTPTATPPALATAAPAAAKSVATPAGDLPAAARSSFAEIAQALAAGQPDRARELAHRAGVSAAAGDPVASWMQGLEALSLLSGGHENDAWTQFFELGRKRLPAGSPPFAIAPIYYAQVAIGDLELAKAQTRGQSWPGWYAPMLDLFAGIGSVAWRGTGEGTGSLASAGAALGRQADWSAGFAPFAAKVSADVATWSTLHGEVDALGRAGRAADAWALLAREPALRDGLLRRAVMSDLARCVEALAGNAWPARPSAETVARLATADIRPLDLDVSTDLKIEKPLATGPLTKSGRGTLTLAGPQPFGGGLVVREGRVVVTGGGWTEPSGAGRGPILVSTGAVLEATGTHQFDGPGSQTELKIHGGRAVFPNECYIRILDLCGGRLETKRDVRIRYEVRVWASEQPSEVVGALGGMLRNDPIKVFVEDGPASPDFRLGESRGTGIRKEGPGQMELRGPVENLLVLGSGSLRWPALPLKIGRVEGRGIVLRPVATAAAQASLDIQGAASFVNKLVIEPIDEAGKGWKPDAPVRWAVIRAQGGLACEKAPEAPPGWKIETDANAVHLSYAP